MMKITQPSLTFHRKRQLSIPIFKCNASFHYVLGACSNKKGIACAAFYQKKERWSYRNATAQNSKKPYKLLFLFEHFLASLPIIMMVKLIEFTFTLLERIQIFLGILCPACFCHSSQAW